MNNAEKAKQYLDKRDYKMEVLQDSGVFRTLKFMHDNSHNGYFMITTWPGHLCISGDMGTYVFSRIHDMIEFFNGDGINPGYWSEKLQSESRFGGGYKKFCIDTFEKNIAKEKSQLIEWADGDDVKIEEIKEAFEPAKYIGDEYEAIDFIRNLDAPGFEACEFSWPDKLTFHYLFACYAINYACNTYLAHKAELAA